LGVQFPARVRQPCLEVGMGARIFLNSVKDRVRPGSKPIHGRRISAGSLDPKGNKYCVDLQFD
jgi:hypothetical protein